VPYNLDLGDYATLSYVWGTVPAASADPITGCLPNRIPKTIRDALTVCITLGFSYLWVDRYCISQDDFVEKLRQIGIMDQIYNNSTLTIIAAAGDNPEHGLPGVKGTPRTTEFRSLAFGQDTRVDLPDYSFLGEIKWSTWNSRAWTYQECVVSRWRLVFTESQVHFECPSKSLWEAFDIRPDLSSIFSSSYSTTGDSHYCGTHQIDTGRMSFSQWKSIDDFDEYLTDFFGKRTSYSEDRLRALAGVISWFNKTHFRVWALSGLIMDSQHETGLSPSLDSDSNEINDEGQLWHFSEIYKKMLYSFRYLILHYHHERRQRAQNAVYEHPA
jgi:hypothetical protein